MSEPLQIPQNCKSQMYIEHPIKSLLIHSKRGFKLFCSHQLIKSTSSSREVTPHVTPHVDQKPIACFCFQCHQNPKQQVEGTWITWSGPPQFHPKKLAAQVQFQLTVLTKSKKLHLFNNFSIPLKHCLSWKRG